MNGKQTASYALPVAVRARSRRRSAFRPANACGSLMMQHFLERLIRFGHLGDFPQMAANMALEPHIVVNARRVIFLLADQRLEALGKRGLLFGAIWSLTGAAYPFLSGGLVIVVACLIAAPVGRRLIQLRHVQPARQPFTDHYSIPWL